MPQGSWDALLGQMFFSAYSVAVVGLFTVVIATYISIAAELLCVKQVNIVIKESYFVLSL